MNNLALKSDTAAERAMKYWCPQSGPQTDALMCPADEIMYGGTRGGGKTDTAIGRHVWGMEEYGPYWSGMVIRQKYKEHARMRSRIRELIAQGHPSSLSGGEQQINYWKHQNGGTVTLIAARRAADIDDWQGSEFNAISIEEAAKIPFIATLIDKVKGFNRSSQGVPCSIFMTGNPGGAGASAIKAMFIPVELGGDCATPEGEVQYLSYQLHDGSTVRFTRVFIHSTLYDNAVLLEKDPMYEARLRSMNDQLLVKAWLAGRWDIFIGQAFAFSQRHIIPPVWPIPEHAPIYMTFDWGYGAPFSIGWWWVDGDGRLIRFGEWYGWDGVNTNSGLRLTDRQVARGVKDREKKFKIQRRKTHRLAGPDCFQKRPDYKGGGQGPSTAEEWAGERLYLNPGDPSRELKIRQFRNRLEVPEDRGELPMLVVYDTCRHFIRVIPSLVMDEDTKEYLEDDQEDHVFDESCHICMARPLNMVLPKVVPDRAQVDMMRVRGQYEEIDQFYEEMDRRVNPELYNPRPDDEEEFAFNMA